MAAEASARDHDPTLVQQILNRQRDHWRRGERVLVETLLENHPTLADDRERLLDLIGNEVDLRAAHGETPRLDEYRDRFPALSDDLGRRFAALRPSSQTLESRDAPSDRTATGDSALSEGVPIPPPTTLPPPDIEGYEVLGLLGKGGMGIVYQARQKAAGRVVALKMILGGFADQETRARFRTEAHAVASLQHPNVVQVFEVGEHRGAPYFSLEFCAGGGLDRKLNGTPLPAAEAARLMETLARAVHHAHEKGIIHRDLKPANVLLTEDGTPKVTDFGLAKKLDDAGRTETGAVMGTPSYMAPEQARGEKGVGPAADVYALGVILYECLTGRPPFKAATTLDTLMQVLQDDPVPPRQLQSKTPRDLETVCLKCLQKDPKRRYANAEALAEDLRRYQAGEPIVGRPVGTAERVLKWARRRPAAAAAYGLLAAALVLGVGGGGATWLWLGAEDARATAVKLKGEAETARGRAETAEGEAKTAKRQLTQYAYDDRVFLAQSQWDAGRPKRARELLDDAGALQETLTPGHRPWEWDYLNRTFHQELVILEGHTDPVRSVAFSPDGARLASAGWDKTVRLWDAASGMPLAVLKGHTDNVESVAFSPDGTRLASAGWDKAVRLWDAASGKPLAVLQHASGVYSVAFSPDGARLASASDDFTVRLWDAASGKPLAVLKGHTGYLHFVAFSPDGSRLASAAADKTVRLWDAATGNPRAVLNGHTDSVSSLAFSPDGARLASAGDTTVRLWDAATGKPLAVLKGHTDYVASVAFSPDGARLASASFDKTVRQWDAATGKPLAVLRGHTDYLTSVAFSPDGARLASASHDKTVRLWDATSSKPLALLEGHREPLRSVAFSPDGARLASAAVDNTVRLWDAGAGKPIAVLKGHTSTVYSVAFSPDGSRLASASGDKTVRLWDAATGKPLAILEGHTDPVASVAFSPDSARLASASWDKTVRLWDAATGKPLAVLEGHTGEVYSLAFSPDGARLASASPDKTVRLWDAATGKPLAVLEGHMDQVVSVAFSPDGARLACTGGDKTIRLWDAATGKPIAVLEGHTSYVESVAFSPDGARLASASLDQTVRVWDVATGKPLAVLEGHTGLISSVTFSPDGARLASGGDTTVRLWIARESPDDLAKRREFAREQQADADEQAGEWFAAAFHLSRLIDDMPADASLYARRGRAELHLGRWRPAAADYLQAVMRLPGDDAPDK